MSTQKIVNKFRKFGLPVDGVAILRNDILAIGDRTIDVHSCNYGYIRTSGRKRYSKGQQITGCDFLNNVTEDLFLVLIIDEGKKLDAYINAARQILDADSDVTILEIDVNKEAIQRAESIPPSLNKIAKISFQYTYQEVGQCDEGVCEYVEDVHCDVEPCESKSFCERVRECIEPVDTDCTLQVGSGCCDYSVEDIELQTGVCVTIPEIINVEDWGDTSEFSIGFQFGDEAQTTWFINFSEPFEQITSAEIISALQLAYGEQQEVVFTYEINGNTICVTPNVDYIGICFIAEAGFLNDSGLASTAITDINLCNEFIINGQFAETDILCANAIENTCLPNDHAQNGLFLGSLNFQVLINDVWTDVTDEVVDGTWQRLNVCDDVITQWRVIDSEDNVINSGDVTATCEGSTEVTDSVCNWLQEHQINIEELEQNKANTSDLGTTAFSNDYNDLDNLPTIPDVSGYVPYTGATQDVDLGANKITVDAVQFNLTPFESPGSGQIAYVGNTGALAYNMNSSQVTSQIGQTLHALVHNADSVQILKGQPVYLFEASGNKASVKLAFNTSDATSAKTFGLAAENISAGHNGFIICQGLLDGLNTSSYLEGDTLYLGATAGTLTKTKPYAPNHLVYIGIVERANNGNGQIYVRIQNGYELDEIHDVDLITSPPVNNDILTYKTGANNLWKPQSIATLLGGTTTQYVRGDGSLATFPTIPTNNNQLINGANYITLAQARAGSYTKFFADFGNTSVNTNTTNNVLGSVLIPANTITGNAILEIETAISRAVSGANPGHRLYIHTSASFGGTQIANIGILTTALWSKGERSFKCSVGSLRGFTFTIAAAIDDAANANAPGSTTPDWTVDQYILTVANNATGETTTHEYTTVKVLTV